MDSFALANSQSFNLDRHKSFTDDEIKNALQKDLETTASIFTMPDGSTFDYNNFFDNDLPKQADMKPEKPQSESGDDQALPSIEQSVDTPANQAASSPKPEQEQTSEIKNDATHSLKHGVNEQLNGMTSSVAIPDFNCLKNDSADPFLFNADGLDDFFSNNDTFLPAFDEQPVNTMPTLASPFQPQAQPPESLSFDFSMGELDKGMAMPPGPPLPNNQALAPHHFPSGRRRSQTVPPDFEPGMSFQRRMGNGMHVPLNRPAHPQPAFPPAHPMRPRPRYGPEQGHMMGLPRSYPITPPSRQPNPNMIMHHPQQHEFMGPSRPQSLNPDLRMSLMNRGRDLSPDRGGGRRGTKRQKQHHDRQGAFPGAMSMIGMTLGQEVDLGMYGLDQAMTGVEFMLRDAVEKVRYGRDEEVERYENHVNDVKRRR